MSEAHGSPLGVLRGELAKTIFDQLSPDVKRRFLLVVAGKHRDLFGETLEKKP